MNVLTQFRVPNSGVVVLDFVFCAGTMISCTTPPSVSAIDNSADALQDVVVLNGALQGLSHSVPYFAYAVPADDSVGNITISNVCARSVDLEWEVGTTCSAAAVVYRYWCHGLMNPILIVCCQAPGNYWRAVTITGYYITSRKFDSNET